MQQEHMYFDTDYWEDAFIEAVNSLGGRKKVAAKLWPHKTVADASRYLSHCLDPERNEKLSMGEIVMIMKWAKDEAKCHAPMDYLASVIGYDKPVPKDPEDEFAQLQRDYIAATKVNERLAKRMAALLPKVQEAS